MPATFTRIQSKLLFSIQKKAKLRMIMLAQRTMNTHK